MRQCIIIPQPPEEEDPKEEDPKEHSDLTEQGKGQGGMLQAGMTEELEVCKQGSQVIKERFNTRQLRLGTKPVTKNRLMVNSIKQSWKQLLM